SAHAGMEADRRRMSSESPDCGVDRRGRLRDGPPRDGLHAGPEADDLHVRGQRPLDLTNGAAGARSIRRAPPLIRGLQSSEPYVPWVRLVNVQPAPWKSASISTALCLSSSSSLSRSRLPSPPAF